MTEHKDLPYIKHILDAIKDINESVKNCSKKQFEEIKDVKDSNVRRIEIIESFEKPRKTFKTL